jgi:hypothetical protein
MFSPGPPVSSTNKADRHDVTEILLKVALNTINHTLNKLMFIGDCEFYEILVVLWTIPA